MGEQEELLARLIAGWLELVGEAADTLTAVVLAAKLKAVNCADTAGQPPDWIAYGSADDTKRCRQVQASAVFMWFLFAAFATTLALTFLGFRRGGAMSD